jgi:hypothetical protein
MALHSAIKGKLICVIGDEVGTHITLFGKKELDTYIFTFNGSVSL